MFVYNNFLHDTRVLKEARSLVASGYDVTILAALDKKSRPFEELHGIKVIRVKIPIHYRIFCLTSECFHWIKKGLMKLISRGVAQFHLPGVAERHNQRNSAQETATQTGINKPELNGNISHALRQRLLGSFRSVHKLFSLMDYYLRCSRIADNQADIYHAHDLNTLPVAWWVARRHGAKLVYDSHELYLEKNLLRLSNRIGKFLLAQAEAFLIRRTNAVITVNESIADELSRRYRIKTPTVVMNAPPRITRLINGNVNLLREALHIKPNYHLLLYTGLLTFNRGLEKMLESLTYLPDCYLVLMGYGTEAYKKRLWKVALRNGIESRVSFFGPVPPDEVIRYAAGADLGVAPIENSCLSYYYCSPNKVFEYINAGLAVIASDFPEMKRVIHQHNIGCTFNPSDPANIARAVRYIFEDAGRWRTMKQNTFAASQCYNWENESEKLLTLYRTLR
ncbi:MAG: glycosyltransferase [Candidatus Brocadia sp.]|nr:glycosyltransferase [Candidatus Brocadia sp.]